MDKYLPREYITLPKVHLQRHNDVVSVTYHATGHQTVIASEDFAAAAIDGWAIHMLATERRIAEAVAAEREACAALCAAFSDEQWKLYKNSKSVQCGNPYTEGVSDGSGACADTIRKRKP